MRVMKILMAACAVALGLLAVAEPAQAHGRWRGGVVLHFGYPGPYYWAPRYWYPPPVYYDPPPVVVVPPAPPPPPVYVERDDEVAPSPAQWWYWCPSAKGYYPYVKECPGGWQRVPPQPTN